MKRKNRIVIELVVFVFLCTVILAVPVPVGAAGAELYGAAPDLAELINRAEPSVVCLIGKISRTSKEYDEASDNILIASGIVYKSNGYIVTNHHVVVECEKMYAVLSNHRVYEADIIASDEDSDLALIKISKGMLTPVEFADSAKARVGASVITIGTPVELGLQNTVGFGIISGIKRGNTGLTEYEYLQTDAAANPGNSGGPLMDMDGKVLGIIAGGYTGFQGLTFCIPSQIIEFVIPQLEQFGKVRRPDIGARLVQNLMADYGLPSGGGLIFVEVQKEGAAADAGIENDDVLLQMNGVRMDTYAAYAEALKRYQPGDAVELSVEKRNGAVVKVEVIFGDGAIQ